MTTLNNIKHWSSKAALTATLALTLGSNVSAAKLETLQDLKTLEARIQNVADLVRPATVGLSSDRGSSGSGVIVNKSGLILTAAHVIRGSKELSVILSDGKVFRGKVLGTNSNKDIGMVQLIEERDWNFAKIGNSKKLKVGSHVIAMGHAGGFDTKRPAPVRFGTLLSKNPRSFMTTDCTLIGGDSGGPLFDLQGRVVGINSSIGGSWKINNHAGVSGIVEDWDRLVKGDNWGKLSTRPAANPNAPFIGITFEDNEDGNGILVKSVLEKSPAAKAGLKEGDIILGVGKKKINTGTDLTNFVRRKRAGDVVTFRVKRKNKTAKVKIKLGNRKNMPKK